jgi:hypothetical protein
MARKRSDHSKLPKVAAMKGSTNLRLVAPAFRCSKRPRQPWKLPDFCVLSGTHAGLQARFANELTRGRKLYSAFLLEIIAKSQNISRELCPLFTRRDREASISGRGQWVWYLEEACKRQRWSAQPGRNARL